MNPLCHIVMKMLQKKQLRAVMILFCCVQFHVQICDEIEDKIEQALPFTRKYFFFRHYFSTLVSNQICVD